MLLSRGGNGNADGRADLHHPGGYTPAAYAQPNGGTIPVRSHGGSGGTSPAAGHSLQVPYEPARPGRYEPAGQPMDQHAKSGYGSPLDLPRADYSNASELSTGTAPLLFLLS